MTRYIAVLICFGAVAVPLAQNTNDITVPFSDTGRPGSINVSVAHGSITVRGESRNDVLVRSSRGDDRPNARAKQPPPGMRRLTSPAGLVVTEQNNQVSITAGGPWNSRETDIELRVPARVNLRLSGVNGDDIVVENVEGQIEATHVNGNVKLRNVSGSVVANTTNGDVIVTFSRLSGEKAMAFSSYNGNVDVTLPDNAKANLRLRSHNGEIFTAFDMQPRAATPAPTPVPATVRGKERRLRFEADTSIYGSINGGGAEFELRTYNGDVFVRRGGQ